MANKPPFDQFDAESEETLSYLGRLQEYLTAYDIADDEDNAAKRRTNLLTSIGSNCFRVQIWHFPIGGRMGILNIEYRTWNS